MREMGGREREMESLRERERKCEVGGNWKSDGIL